MALTPVEIRHITFGRSLFGYGRAHVDKLLDDIVDSFEQVWRERADLADKVEHLEAELARFRELESVLRTTLVSAEQAAEQLRDHARREAELVLTEAQAEARALQRRAVIDNERMVMATRRLRAQLTEAAAVLDENPEEGAGWLVVPDADAA
jgi:cell division initiation protein